MDSKYIVSMMVSFWGGDYDIPEVYEEVVLDICLSEDEAINSAERLNKSFKIGEEYRSIPDIYGYLSYDRVEIVKREDDDINAVTYRKFIPLNSENDFLAEYELQERK